MFVCTNDWEGIWVNRRIAGAGVEWLWLMVVVPLQRGQSKGQWRRIDYKEEAEQWSSVVVEASLLVSGKHSSVTIAEVQLETIATPKSLLFFINCDWHRVLSLKQTRWNTPLLLPPPP